MLHPHIIILKKDLSKDAVELWNLAEFCFNNMVGNSNIQETLLPVLPNLVTTTDEVTIFATDEKIHPKEKQFGCKTGGNKK